ncbi:MAG: type I glutamate--ammonia ligase, partial [Pseudopedobacter sp.]|nr:type I glutamate--ammonia ligase [Deinococcales bacterium]
TAMLAAGLDGIQNSIEPPPAIERNIYKMTVREKRKHRIRELPGDLGLALDELEKSELMHATLGEHLFEKFLEAKRAEWLEYSAVVHPWELERYLANI